MAVALNCSFCFSTVREFNCANTRYDVSKYSAAAFSKSCQFSHLLSKKSVAILVHQPETVIYVLSSLSSSSSNFFINIDSNLRFDCHVRNVAKACNFHTRALRHVRSLLTDNVAQTVACSIVASRLDYCNALLSGALAATFDKLQRAQNNLARVVCQSRGRTDARPMLHSLHWLPVWQRVTYKLAVLTHKVRSTAAPTYLSELVQTRAVHHLGFCALPML